MSYDFYRILHLVIVITLFFSLGGLWLLYEAPKNSPLKSFKKFLITLHGVSLLVALIAGLGLIVKLSVPSPWPLWVYVKFLIWIVLGAFPFILKKATSVSNKQTKTSLLLVCLLGTLFLAVITARLKY